MHLHNAVDFPYSLVSFVYKILKKIKLYKKDDGSSSFNLVIVYLLFVIDVS